MRKAVVAWGDGSWGADEGVHHRQNDAEVGILPVAGKNLSR